MRVTRRAALACLVVTGGPGADELLGGRDDDTLYGEAGADTIEGGPGNDMISAGPMEEKDVDTVRGEEGNDTISVANRPASKDTVGCGQGDNDKVIADSLDVVSDSCEDVKRIPDEEPNLTDGTYQLVPDPSSECNLGQGNFTVQTDPESGEHGIVIELGETEAKDVNAAEGCELDIDYQSAVTAQGDISAQSTNTRKYKGRKITQQRIDQAKEDAGQAAEESTTSIPSSGTSGEFNAQWAWTYRTYTHYMQTFDPAFYKVNSTWNQLTWWHNGYDTDYYYPLSDARDGGCWGSHNRLSEWNISSCRFNGGMWYGYSSSRSWIGSELSAKYYDYYFGDNNLSTRAYHTSRVWGYSLGYAGNRPTWSIYGEFATALRVSSFGQYPY